MKEIVEKLPSLLRVIDNAGAAIMRIYNAKSAVEKTKADNTPVTQADIKAHRLITFGFGRLFPEIPVVSEEGDQIKNRKLVKKNRFWLVDPLDGTREFLKRTDNFTVCAALVEKGVPTFGIVAAPAFDVTYYGGRGMGSFKREGRKEAVPIHVSSVPVGKILGSRSNREDGTTNYINEHYPDSEILAVGSQLKLPYLAEGKADAYPRIGGPLHIWDLAAGHAILAAAGGSLTRPDGSAIDYQTDTLKAGDFVATRLP